MGQAEKAREKSPARRRMLKAIKLRLKAVLQDDRPVLFVTEHLAPSTHRGDPDAKPELPGLVFRHELDAVPGEGTTFVSYWESREAFEASRTPLEQWIGTQNLRRSAWVRKPETESKPFWKRISIYGMLLHVAAFLGAMTALGELRSALFEAPAVSIQFETSEPLNVLEGSPLETFAVLTNQKPNVSARVSKLGGSIKGSAGPIPVHLSTEPQLLDKSGSLRVPIKIDRLTEVGSYTLDIEGTGESGILASRQRLSISRPLTVWDRNPRIHLSFSPVSETRLEVTGLLLSAVPAPSGLRCSMRLIDEPSLRFGPMDFLEMAEWPDPTTSLDGTVSNQSWTTPPLRPYSKIPFTLYIDGTPSTAWKQVGVRLKATCSEANLQEHP